MPAYRFHYRHTEYRQLVVTADTPGQALEKYIYGDGEDSFVGTDDSPVVLAIDTPDPNDVDADWIPVWDADLDYDDVRDPSTAIALYNAMRLRYLCDRTGA